MFVPKTKMLIWAYLKHITDQKLYIKNILRNILTRFFFIEQWIWKLR